MASIQHRSLRCSPLVLIRENTTNVTKMATNYKLGPLPWSRETLIKAHWANWVATAEDIKEHPGCAAQEALQAVQMGIDLFVD